MVRKVALVQQTEQARLVTLRAVYDAIAAAAENSRLYYVGTGFHKDEPPTALLAELRNQAIILTALAPPQPALPDPASEQLTRMFLSLFPGLAVEENSP